MDSALDGMIVQTKKRAEKGDRWIQGFGRRAHRAKTQCQLRRPKSSEVVVGRYPIKSEWVFKGKGGEEGANQRRPKDASPDKSG